MSRAGEGLSLARSIDRLQGPILVLGASGFVGSNLYRALAAHRNDVFGTTTHSEPWRLEGLPQQQIITTDLLVEHNIETLLDTVRPRTVFDLVAYGAYSFEQDVDLIYRTNINYVVRLVEALLARNIHRYVHAGSSSEYGDNSAAPPEKSPFLPDSHYSVSKGSIAGLLRYYGAHRKFPAANLRLYSVYGPYEDAARLIPNLLDHVFENSFPKFVDAEISRDFIYVDDVVKAFVLAANQLEERNYGESYNIGTGRKTTIRELAWTAREVFAVATDPVFGSMAKREWDHPQSWYADPSRARDELGWAATVGLAEGLAMTMSWYQNLPSREGYRLRSKKFGYDERHSVSAVIACYKDGQAIPIMYRRLKEVFAKLNIDHEIIFVNDNSPDNSEEVIRDLSAADRHVTGICHARNFGSQAAFRSGMEIASKNSVVLLDGDLQDPPELIEQFVAEWRKGSEVVYGRRIKREAPWHMQILYKIFYRIFKKFSYICIPNDAGDFSLLDRRVVNSILQFPERDLFLRGVRAYAGYRQTGVDYVRPERMFGVTTNSFLKNVGWAKKGILSFSNVPLNMLSFSSTILFIIFAVLSLLQVVLRFIFPDAAPRGVTTTLLIITFFGTFNMMAVALVGEYVAKIFEEVKRRPHFIRRAMVRNGEVRNVSSSAGAVGRLC